VSRDRYDDDGGIPPPGEPPGEVAEVYPFPGQGEARPFPRVDLAALARAGVPEPERVCSGLLYRGGLHSLAGPPDSGKSTLLYVWTLELLAAGAAVVLLDEEAGRELVTEKLLALGATPALLDPARLVYAEFPARAWDAADRRGLAALLGEVRPALVGFDSAGAFLAQAGLRENDAPDVTALYKGVLLPAARTSGAAVVVLDHVTKQEDAGRYARGSGAKLGLVDVAFMVEPITPFTRTASGLLRLRVAKDRRGWLHRAHEVRVDVEDGQLALAITPEAIDPAGGTEGALTSVDHDPAVRRADLGPAARKLLEAMRELGRPATWGELVDQVKARHHHGLRRPTVSTNLNKLARAGLADSEAGDGDGKRWWALRPDGTPWTADGGA